MSNLLLFNDTVHFVLAVTARICRRLGVWWRHVVLTELRLTILNHRGIVAVVGGEGLIRLDLVCVGWLDALALLDLTWLQLNIRNFLGAKIFI